MAVQAGPSAVVEDFYRRTNAGERAESGIDMEHPVAHLLFVEKGLISAWWMFGDPEKARRRFLAGDRPG